MKKMSFFWYGLMVGGCHFAASLLIIPLTLRAGAVSTPGSGMQALLAGLHLLTRILYFPVMGLALYPRYWFPGPWIAIPILINSLLWGMLLAGLFMLLRRLRTIR